MDSNTEIPRSKTYCEVKSTSEDQILRWIVSSSSGRMNSDPLQGMSSPHRRRITSVYIQAKLTVCSVCVCGVQGEQDSAIIQHSAY